jgi:beta-glucosidase
VKKVLRSTNIEAHANMRKLNHKTLTATAFFLMASCAYAQNSDSPAYLNPSLPAEQRAADLVHRMTVEEKVSQLTNQSRAIERLRIPAYNSIYSFPVQ